MSRIILPRRTFLRAAGGISLGLPLMSSLGCSPEEQKVLEKVASQRQAEGRFPKRFLAVYTPNGNYEMPTADLDGQWAALKPFKSKINVLRGIDQSVCAVPPGEPHQSGMAMMTGRPLNQGMQVGGDGSLAGWASGISMDQELANQIGKGTKRKSLHAGVQSTAYGGTEVRTVISYEGSDQPVANTTDPFVMFNDVFSDLGTDPEGLAKLKARRTSVLNAVQGRYAAITQKISQADKDKLDQHLEAISEVEAALKNPGGVIGGNCQMPDTGPSFDINDPSNFGKIGKIHMDLISMAFACDLTRVATLQWSASTNNRPYPFLQYNGAPITDDEHSLGHMPDSATDAWGKLNVIRTWYNQQLAYLLGKLDSVPEGSGTMLDNTVVMLFSEISRGNTHSHMDTPFVVAGKGGGYFKTGQYIDFAGPGDKFHNDLLVSIMNAMGVETATWGDPAFCTGEISELKA